MTTALYLSPNFTKGRNGHKIEAIVLHITESNTQSAISHLSNPASQVSAHYLVTQYPPIVLQLVKDEDTAWANGIVVNPSWKNIKSQNLGANNVGKMRFEPYQENAEVGERGSDLILLEKDYFGRELLEGSPVIINPNFYTLSIEVAIPSADYLPQFNQWKLVAELVKEKAKQYNLSIEPKDEQLIGHNQIRSNKACPGFYISPFMISNIIKYFL